jgi:hypothetical protein
MCGHDRLLRRVKGSWRLVINDRSSMMTVKSKVCAIARLCMLNGGDGWEVQRNSVGSSFINLVEQAAQDSTKFFDQMYCNL